MSENSEFVALARKYGLSPVILREVILYRARGHNNMSISTVAGISKNTVNKYVHALRVLPEEDFALCMRAVFGTGSKRP